LLADAVVAQSPERHADAERFIEESRALGGDDDPTTRMICDAAHALVESARGEHARALALARSAVRAARRTDLLNQIGDTGLALARVLAAAGHHDAARQAVAEAADRYRVKANVRALATCDQLLVRFGAP
jgi:ATP/maltotriose-dependent transcriptional regulator MalT